MLLLELEDVDMEYHKSTENMHVKLFWYSKLDLVEIHMILALHLS